MIKFILNKKSNKERGLTMLELLIAVAIFVIVVSIVFGLFLTSLKGYRKAIAIQNVQDNARFLLSFIAKEIRMSDIRIATLNGTTPDLYITRNSPVVEDIDYFFNDVEGYIERNGEPMNSEEVSVTGSFYTSGVGVEAPPEQPRITILLRVETKGAQKVEERAEAVIQTTLSTRNLEL